MMEKEVLSEPDSEFPDVIIKLEEEEEPWVLDHQRCEDSRTIQGTNSGYPNDEKVEKEIIEFYRSNPHLWNPSHVDYYKKNRRDSTLTVLRDLLASEHGINITSNKILSKKFKNMKDAYKRELSKLQKSKLSGVGTNNVHKIRFPYFKEMDFLRDSMQADESEDTINLSISLENATDI
nr:uncharacterized protein LOC132765243 isoform X7 [Anolis sagrei ordinatus]